MKMHVPNFQISAQNVPTFQIFYLRCLHVHCWIFFEILNALAKFQIILLSLLYYRNILEFSLFWLAFAEFDFLMCTGYLIARTHTHTHVWQLLKHDEIDREKEKDI